MSYLNKLLYFVFISIVISCGSKEEKTETVNPENEKEQKSDVKSNLIVFFIPGLDQDIMSFLHDDPNSENLKNFKSIGAYAPKSYFENYSDFESNMTAIMSGKTTLNGHLGIDKDSIANKTWLHEFKNENYQIAYICDKSLGSVISGSIFTGKQNNFKYDENSVLNLVRFEPDFIWGMGTNLFERRLDGKNLFEELGIKNYNLVLDINNIQNKSDQKFAAVFNNYSIPDSIDLINKGLTSWFKVRNKGPYVLLIIISELEEALKSKDKKELYKINRYIDFVINKNSDPQNNLFLIINPFQNYKRQFDISSGDTLSYTSIPLDYNQMDNNVWAYGVNSESFTGFYQNADISRKITSIIKQ